MPGLQLIYNDLLPIVEDIALTHFAKRPELFNWHAIRQFYEADGGSGFGVHQDDADDGEEGDAQLMLSAAVKLTADPQGGEGTWMQVVSPPRAPVRYGAAAGSVVVFPSRAWHRSARTPLSMGKVYKIVFFFRAAAGEIPTNGSRKRKAT